MNPAVFDEAAYEMVGSGNKAKRLQKTQDVVNGHDNTEGWTIVPESSNKQMVTFRADDGRMHISHRGTSLKRNKDLAADLSIALGHQSDDKRFKRRSKMTENIMKANPDAQFSLSGHSYGGSLALHTATTNRYVGDNITQVDTHNLGASLLGTTKVGKKRKKMLGDKITHHRTNGDVISASALLNSPIGNVVNYDSVGTPSSRVTQVVATAVGLGLTNKALYDHKLHHFF